MKIALLHELLTANEGGAEYVFKLIAELFPEAPVYTWVYDRDRTNPYWKTRDVRASLIQKMPWGVKKYQWYLPLMPIATDHFDLREFDLIISSSSNLIKGAIAKPGARHLCYCHTPPRFLWTEPHDYLRELRQPRIVKWLIPALLTPLRLYDQLAANRVDAFIANSKNVQNRIKKFYRRDSVIINPPVNAAGFNISEKIGDYYLAGGRLMAYKRFDIIVKAFNRLNIPLKIFGDGAEFNYLKSLAKENIVFLGKISDAEKFKLFRECIAFINPQEEDWGITPIEAMASGRPVIGYGRGGNLETIIPGITGELFAEQTWECLGEKIVRFDPAKFNPKIIRDHALQFSEEIFKEKIKEIVAEEMEKCG